MLRTHPSTLLSGLLLAALAALAASPATAQWDAVAYEPSAPVYDEGFLLIHENLDGIHAFSAVTRKWTRLSQQGPTIEGTGDWIAMLSEPVAAGIDFTGYSARRNRTDTLLVREVHHLRVEDDIALLIATLPDGNVYGCGFSGVTARWEVTPLGFIPDSTQFATSRFVAGIVGSEQQILLGFAARTGQWAPLGTNLAIGVPEADGNTLIVPLQLIGGPPQLAAFSGVRGTWALSPPFIFDDLHSPLLDHNVAYVRVPAGNGFNGAGYSAYTALWFQSAAVHALHPSVGELISDNVVLITDENMFIPAPRYEAFGSRPSSWHGVFGNWNNEYLDEDYALIRSGTQPLISGFSGLCKGEWVHEQINSENTAFPLPSPDHLGVMQEPGGGPGNLDRLWLFRPSRATWIAPFDLIPGTTTSIADLMLDIDQPDLFDPNKRELVAATDRWGGWRAETAPAGTYDVVVGGSVIAHKLTTTADPTDVGKIWLFDERCDRWQPPFDPGVDQPLDADRNVLVSYPKDGELGIVWGYSVQRGEWHRPVAVSPLKELPRLEENVAWFVDGSNEPQLFGFGSPNIGHVDYQWPNGTEYHASATPDVPIPGPLFAYTVLGTPGITFHLPLLSNNVDCDGTTLDGFDGVLCLVAPVSTAIGVLPFTDADCLTEFFAQINSPVSPCLQLWLQPLMLNPFTAELRFEHRCDPAWFF